MCSFVYIRFEYFMHCGGAGNKRTSHAFELMKKRTDVEKVYVTYSC